MRNGALFTRVRAARLSKLVKEITCGTTLQAKTHFSKLLHAAQAGEEVLITSGREKTPVARLMPVERKGGIQFGLMKDLMSPTTADLLEPMSEAELRDWEDSEIFP